MPFFGRDLKPKIEPGFSKSGNAEKSTTSENNGKLDLLSKIGVRQHAAIVGLLVERHVLISNQAVYVVDGLQPEVGRVLQIDTGLLWIALAVRLGGDTTVAEDALREAIWAWAKLVATDTGVNGIGEIDLTIAEATMGIWKANNSDWFTSFLNAAFHYLHPDKPITPDGIGTVWQDAWRLYAGALSVLGDATSRRVPGDSEDYCSENSDT